MVLEGLSEELFPLHKQRLVLQLTSKVTVHPNRLNIDFNLDGLMDLILELLADQTDLVKVYRQLYSSARSHGLWLFEVGRGAESIRQFRESNPLNHLN